MKFLADENIPQIFISYLRKHGHDVSDSKYTMSEASDTAVLLKAEKEKRILLTFDKDFLEPITPKALVGIIVFHFPNTQPQDILPWLDATVHFLSKEAPKRPFRLLVQRQNITLQ